MCAMLPSAVSANKSDADLLGGSGKFRPDSNWRWEWQDFQKDDKFKSDDAYTLKALTNDTAVGETSEIRNDGEKIIKIS